MVSGGSIATGLQIGAIGSVSGWSSLRAHRPIIGAFAASWVPVVPGLTGTTGID